MDSAADDVTGSSEELLVAATTKDKKDRISSVNGGKIYSHLFKVARLDFFREIPPKFEP